MAYHTDEARTQHAPLQGLLALEDPASLVAEFLPWADLSRARLAGPTLARLLCPWWLQDAALHRPCPAAWAERPVGGRLRAELDRWAAEAERLYVARPLPVPEWEWRLAEALAADSEVGDAAAVVEELVVLGGETPPRTDGWHPGLSADADHQQGVLAAAGSVARWAGYTSVRSLQLRHFGRYALKTLWVDLPGLWHSLNSLTTLLCLECDLDLADSPRALCLPGLRHIGCGVLRVGPDTTPLGGLQTLDVASVVLDNGPAVAALVAWAGTAVERLAVRQGKGSSAWVARLLRCLSAWLGLRCADVHACVADTVPPEPGSDTQPALALTLPCLSTLRLAGPRQAGAARPAALDVLLEAPRLETLHSGLPGVRLRGRLPGVAAWPCLAELGASAGLLAWGTDEVGLQLTHSPHLRRAALDLLDCPLLWRLSLEHLRVLHVRPSVHEQVLALNGCRALRRLRVDLWPQAPIQRVECDSPCLEVVHLACCAAYRYCIRLVVPEARVWSLTLPWVCALPLVYAARTESLRLVVAKEPELWWMELVRTRMPQGGNVAVCLQDPAADPPSAPWDTDAPLLGRPCKSE